MIMYHLYNTSLRAEQVIYKNGNGVKTKHTWSQ